MKKLLLAGGACLLRMCAIFAAIGFMFLLAPSSYAQSPTYTLTFSGFPPGSAGVNLSDYVGLDRKLKTNVPGHTLTISVTPPPPPTKQFVLRIEVSASGSLTECNGSIAWAETVPFTIIGGTRTLGASDFTASGGIGIQDSHTEQPCVDALSDKITKGVASIPTGSYTVKAILENGPSQPIPGATGSYTLTISAASIAEAILNLTSPANGAQVNQSPSVTFDFNNSIAGRLLVFEHSSLSQSPDDATRDDNSPLKIVDADVKDIGSPQFIATYPGTALRPWTAGKKYSWYFRGSSSGSSGSADVKKSPIWSFVVVSSDPNLSRLINALQAAPDPIGSSYTNFVNAGYTLNLNGSFYLQEGDNAVPQQKTIDQILTLLSSLAQKNVQIRVGVTQ